MASVQTASPFSKPATSPPTSSTTPAASKPMVAGKLMGMKVLRAPDTIFQSMGLTLAPLTRNLDEHFLRPAGRNSNSRLNSDLALVNLGVPSGSVVRCTVHTTADIV